MLRIGQSAEKISMTNSKEMAYITGVYMSDGSLSHHNRGYQFRLSCIDEDYVQETSRCFNIVIGKEGTISKQKKIPKGRVNAQTGKIIQQKNLLYYFSIYSKEIFEKLKEETKEKDDIPEWIKNSSNEIKLSFLSGMIDGDGWITYNISGTGRGLTWQVGLSGRETAMVAVNKMCNAMGLHVWGLSKVKASKGTFRLFFDVISTLQSGLSFKIKRKQNKLEFIRKILNDYMLISKTQPKRIQDCLLDEDIVGTSGESQS